MGDKPGSVKVDGSGAMFVLGVFLLIILYWGEPDLHDALMYRLMGPGQATVDEVSE